MSAQSPNFDIRGAVDLSALTAPQAETPPAGGFVVDVTMDSFQQVVEESAKYPVVALLWMPTEPTNVALAETLVALADEFAGQFLLARMDVQAYPQMAQVFGVQGVPTTVAILGGQPMPLFGGAAEADQIRPVLQQLLEAAATSGITGRVAGGEDPGASAGADAPAEEASLPPLHQEAYDAIERGDFPAAVAAYELALKQDPKDGEAQAGLAQSRLFVRLNEGADGEVNRDEVYGAAAADPANVEAALKAADLEMLEGGAGAAFDRLLALMPAASAEDKETLRVRLLEYFEIVGPTNPGVNPARRKMALYLY